MNRFVTYIIYLLVSCFLILQGQAQIVINEICSRNNITFKDNYNNYPDWIELYNQGNDVISLNDWSISDDISNPEKWTFPDIVIYPDSYLVVFASDKDDKEIVDHWETLIHADNIWKYLTPFSNPDPAWKNFEFDDSNWMEGPGGFGRGDDDDNTILPDTVRTVYIRKNFSIVDTSLISSALLQVDYDDAFVAYLNGVEIARANIGWPGNIQNWDDFSRNVHPAVMFQGLPPEDFYIDINLFKSIINEGENVLAIQALNAWNNHGNSSIIPFLSVGIKDNSFTYQELPEWFGDKPVFLHTNFKLSGIGEGLILSDPNQDIIDTLNFPYTKSDHSYGRETDGNNSWKYFGVPTPGNNNGLSDPYLGYTKKPEFSIESGYYNENIQVQITNQEPGDTIKFSLDGGWLVDTSEIYSDVILIDSTSVLRAQIFKSGFLPGDVASNTYFIDFETELSVISISLNPHDLWDWDEGIYVMGPNANPSFPFKGANFWMDWEKPANIEFFNKNKNLGFELEADIKIHGGFSRAKPMKSLRILTSGKYDQSEINYQIFEDKDIQKFNRLILRNSGQDYNDTHFRDALIHKIVQDKTNILVQDYEPAVVFLNGEYWGIHNIREKIDRFYISENFGIHVDSTELLKENHMVVEGDLNHYVKMIDYIRNLTVVDSIVYDSISKLIHIDNYTDYFIAEMYFVNSDGWPGHNTKYCRAANDTARWHYILTDTDFCLGLYSQVYKNELYRVLYANFPFSHNHWPFRKLLLNNNYKRYFINRSADMYNTMLLPFNVMEQVDLFKNCLSPEMDRHMTRWEGSYAEWETNVNVVMEFAQNRLGYIWQHYIDEFELDTLVTIGLDVDSIHHGTIKMNTIIPDSLPWQGIYFDGNSVDITAIADSGFLFSHWQTNMTIQNEDTLKESLTVNVDTNDIFKAFFVLDTIVPDTPLVVFNEINYRSVDTLDADDWVEIWNVDTTVINLSGWVFKDGNDEHEFIIPTETILETSEYLVLCQDTTKFLSIYPEIINVIGLFDFGLVNEGEELRLFDNTGILVVSTLYSNVNPWPTDADGTGRTIELIDPYGDLNDGNNWFSGCLGGSPGGPFIECDTVGIQHINDRFPGLKVYPNPFSNFTTFEFNIEKEQKIQIEVYDVFGNLVLKEQANYLLPGNKRFILNRKNMESGLYFYKVHFKENIQTGKLLIR